MRTIILHAVAPLGTPSPTIYVALQFFPEKYYVQVLQITHHVHWRGMLHFIYFRLGVFKTIEGEVDIGSQYHYFMETQSALVRPIENGEFDVFVSSQFPLFIQDGLARIMNAPFNKFNVHVST